MKKFWMILLVLCLLCSAAGAETTVTSRTLDFPGVEMVSDANMFIVTDENKLEHVADRDLNILSDGYYFLSYDVYGAFRAKTEDNKEGTVNVDGSVMIPVTYDDIKIFNDRWGAGITWKEGTEEDYDYKVTYIVLGGENEVRFMQIDTVDFYYLNEKKGSISREEYRSVDAYGDFLRLRDPEGNASFYNKDFEKSPAGPDAYSEYDYDYKNNTVIHNGSGKEAFCAGCELTADQVQQTIFAKGNELVDLQGNVLADLGSYTYSAVNVSENLVTVKEGDKEGLLDETGKAVIPCKYDSIGYSMDLAKKTGLLDVELDGKLGFVSLKDGSEGGFVFSKDEAKAKGAFIYREDNGTVTIATIAGQLPTTYAKIYPARVAPYAAVTDAEGKISLIGLAGENVLPDMPEVKYDSSINCSADGTMILVYTAEREYILYTVSYDPDLTALQ